MSPRSRPPMLRRSPTIIGGRRDVADHLLARPDRRRPETVGCPVRRHPGQSSGARAVSARRRRKRDTKRHSPATSSAAKAAKAAQTRIVASASRERCSPAGCGCDGARARRLRSTDGLRRPRPARRGRLRPVRGARLRRARGARCRRALGLRAPWRRCGGATRQAQRGARALPHDAVDSQSARACSRRTAAAVSGPKRPSTPAIADVVTTTLQRSLHLADLALGFAPIPAPCASTGVADTSAASARPVNSIAVARTPQRWR